MGQIQNRCHSGTTVFASEISEGNLTFSLRIVLGRLASGQWSVPVSGRPFLP